MQIFLDDFPRGANGSIEAKKHPDLTNRSPENRKN